MKNFIAGIILTLLAAKVIAAPTGACSASAYQAFDFWLGEWTVTTPDGKQAGTNLIEKDYNGCVVTERYTNADGPYGSSITMYDKTTGKWHQVWGDKTGLRLDLSGGMTDGAMVLRGQTGTSVNALIHKISWTAEENGSVIQHWQVKNADQKNWRTLFTGIYSRKIN
ncbi:hypothetical protein OCL06_07730 [Alteromonas sp. ASW11-19]|uniref:DUF1579 domain-containing protein n=1 Tax=Alteromonas salexigens TaxID=2982530 RepID=A0ABT2VME2_9ALTE|nr:hypothetical protein [Alteromonas salexigens]MCU7554485.1 hypothetical protein [Alteromonas salexigens]